MLPAIKILIALLGLAAFGGAVAYFGLPPNPPAAPSVDSGKPAGSPAPTPAPLIRPEPAPAAPSQAIPALEPPEFDIVRVEPTGELVVAGRAPPAASVELLRDGRLYDQGKSDDSGHFVLLPRPLPPGTAQLSLLARAADGRTQASRQSVTVAVPEKSKPSDVVVALSAPNKPTEILAAPGAAVPMLAEPKSSPAAGAARRQIAILSVESDETGAFFVSGTAAPDAVTRLYLNETYIAAAIASPEGRWSFIVQKGLGPGSYRVRLDDVEPFKGTVLSRAEVPFDIPANGVAALKPSEPAEKAEPTVTLSFSAKPDPAEAATVVPELRTATVSRGDSLWRISRKIYGTGFRYTVIHEANQAQIRNPDKIYPGQVFVLPGDRRL